MDIKIGDIVTRKSYNHDIVFRVSNVDKQIVQLLGVELRLEADAPLDDLTIAVRTDLEKIQKKSKEKEEFSYRLFRQDYQLMREKKTHQISGGYKRNLSYFQLPAKVLHLDGDLIYLRKCISLYQRIGLHVHGVHLSEKEMP